MTNSRGTKEVVVISFFWTMLAVMILFAITNMAGGKLSKNNDQYVAKTTQSKSIESKAEVYQSILKGNPGSLKALIGLADLYFDNRQYHEAIATFLKAEKIDPTSVHIENDLGLLYLNTTNYDIAMEKFQKALEVDPTHTDSLYYIGLIHHYKGDTPQALRVFKQILSSNPSPELAKRVAQEISKLKSPKFSQ